MTETSPLVSAVTPFYTGTTPLDGECGAWPTELGFLAWLCQVLVSLMSAWWPLLVLAAVVALLAGAVLARVVRMRRRLERDGAVFFEIVPPHHFPVDGALSLWRMLAGVLSEHRTRRLCVELWAHGRNGTVRAGIWIPATPDRRALIRHLRAEGLSWTSGAASEPTTGTVGAAPPTPAERAAGRGARQAARQVARGVAMTWPGCAIVPVPAPVSGVGASAACELVPRHGPWTAMLDHERGAPHRTRGPLAGEDEPLRVVLAELAELARHGHYAAVQVVVSATADAWAAGAAGAPGLAAILRGGVGPAARRRVAVGAARALARVSIAVLDEVVTGVRELLSPSMTRRASTRSSTTRARSATAVGARPGRSGQIDSVVLARVQAREAKQRHGPHLRATVRFAVAGTATAGQASRATRALATTLTALALDQDTVSARPVRARTAARVVAGREHGRSFIASARELAAMWHLPHEPARHRLVRPNVPRRRPDRALPRLGRQQVGLHQTHPQPPQPPRAPASRPAAGPPAGLAARTAAGTGSGTRAGQPAPGAPARGSDWEEGARDAA